MFVYQVWMPTKIYLHTYYYIPFLNDQSFHHWQKLCKSNWRAKSVSTSNMCQSSLCSSNYTCTTVTCYCLTLNGRTVFTKAHSIDKNTIYAYKYNFLNWFLCPRDYWLGSILLYPCPPVRPSVVRPSVRPSVVRPSVHPSVRSSHYSMHSLSL